MELGALVERGLKGFHLDPKQRAQLEAVGKTSRQWQQQRPAIGFAARQLAQAEPHRLTMSQPAFSELLALARNVASGKRLDDSAFCKAVGDARRRIAMHGWMGQQIDQIWGALQLARRTDGRDPGHRGQNLVRGAIDAAERLRALDPALLTPYHRAVVQEGIDRLVRHLAERRGLTFALDGDKPTAAKAALDYLINSAPRAFGFRRAGTVHVRARNQGWLRTGTLSLHLT